MSVTYDAFRAIRAWEREHNRRPDVVFLNADHYRAIVEEALPPFTPEQAERIVALFMTGDDSSSLRQYSLRHDPTLADREVRPAILYPRQIFTGIQPEGRIVAPESEALILQSALNDPTLHLAFDSELAGTGAQILSTATMAIVGVDHPVLVLPAATRAAWESQDGPRLPEYSGPLPDRPVAAIRQFDLVKPGGGAP